MLGICIECIASLLFGKMIYDGFQAADCAYSIICKAFIISVPVSSSCAIAAYCFF